MDFSPPPFLSSSSWYVLWAFCLGRFWQGERQGRPGDSLRVEGRGPCGCSSLMLFAVSLLSNGLSRLFFRCASLLSGDDFYLELGVLVILSRGTTVALSFSFLLLCLWTGPNELVAVVEGKQ